VIRLLAPAALLAALGVAVAAAGPRAERPRALLTYTASPRTSPDDQYLVCLARSNGTDRRRIVEGTLSASAAAWNRDGSRVAFTGWNLPAGFGSPDETDVVEADAGGRLIRNLTAGFSSNNFNPKWSRNGRWIAFVSDPLVLTLVPADGSQAPKAISLGDFAGDVGWFPNGRRLVVSKFRGDRIGVYSIRLDGRGLRFLANGNEPAVSPNGRRLAFVRIVGESRFVFVAGANGSRPHRLTHGTTAPEEDPAWSPDGRWIAFERTIDPGSLQPRVEIVVSRSNGKSA
jgi:Tol biopolymer transport system component